MHSIALDRVEQLESPEAGPTVQLLLANAHPDIRRQLTALALDWVGTLAVIEAADGAEALRIALQRRPQIALLGVAMPHLGGLEAAITIRELEPRMRVALHTVDVPAYRAWAHQHGLPLFDSSDHARVLGWLELQVQTFAGRLVLECTCCGYGVVRSTPPERCPMCQARGAWALVE